MERIEQFTDENGIFRIKKYDENGKLFFDLELVGKSIKYVKYLSNSIVEIMDDHEGNRVRIVKNLEGGIVETKQF